MSVFAPIVGFVVGALSAGSTIFRLGRYRLPRSQLFAIMLFAAVTIGAVAANLVLVSQRDMGDGVQQRLDAIRVHIGNLKRRIDLNVAAMEAALAEPPGDPPSRERDQAWQKRIAALAHETQTLLQERDRLPQEIEALHAGAAAAADNREMHARLAILLMFGIPACGSIVWLTLFLAARGRRIESRAASTGPHSRPTCDQVKQLAASGKKIAAIAAYRQATGASLLEAKNAVEALSGP